MENKFVISFLAVVVLALAGLLVIQSLPSAISLPSNAVKLSECVPNMGAHYGNPADLPFGPIFLVDKDKVVGVEYMMHEDELEKNILTIGGEEIGKSVVMQTMGARFDHIELNFLPKGHEGDAEPHYDVHMYLVSQQEQSKLCQ